jgi:hypothetical protein
MKPPKKQKGGVHLDFKQADVIGWKDLPMLEGEKEPADEEQAAATKEKLIESKQKKIKEFYPIYSDVPHAWQADLLKIPHNKATSKESVRLHHFLVLININTKFCFVERLLFKGKARDDDYRPGKKAP